MIIRTVKQHDYNDMRNDHNIMLHEYNVMRHHYNVKRCAAHGTFRYFELCSICLREGLGCSKPTTNPRNKHKQHNCGDFYYIQAILNRLLHNKMSTTSGRELGYLFLTMSSVHIIASDLDVRDHCHG
jgi:hypothetical protein